MDPYIKKLTPEEVISKLKDDGDFDRLRLKIIRKLKENEELRNSIKSVVKESAAINHPRAEKMKTRELCDAILEEVREKVESQISEGLWEIIRAGDGMKTEITETVQSVYEKMLNPHQGRADAGQSASVAHRPPTPMRPAYDPVGVSTDEHGGGTTILNEDPKRLPGYSMMDYTHDKLRVGHHVEQQNKSELRNESLIMSEHEDGEHPRPPPGFPAPPPPLPSEDESDDDPDVPPGFG